MIKNMNMEKKYEHGLQCQENWTSFCRQWAAGH